MVVRTESESFGPTEGLSAADAMVMWENPVRNTSPEVEICSGIITHPTHLRKALNDSR